MNGQGHRWSRVLALTVLLSAGCAAPSVPAPVRVPAADLGPGNTGWRHTGVELRDATCGPNGDLIVDRDGTQLDGLRIPCSVVVLADDVRITRSEITTTGIWGIKKDDANTGLLVEDTEVIGTSGCAVGIGFSSITVRRADVHGCSDGVHPETGSVLEDSWIHDLSPEPGKDGGEAHNDGVQTTGGSDIVIRNNKIQNPGRQTSAVLIGGNFGAPSRITITDNYLDGGNYTLYLDPAGTDRVVRDNTFTRNFVYGPAAVHGAIDWSGNVFAEDGAPVER